MNSKSRNIRNITLHCAWHSYVMKEFLNIVITNERQLFDSNLNHYFWVFQFRIGWNEKQLTPDFFLLVTRWWSFSRKHSTQEVRNNRIVCHCVIKKEKRPVFLGVSFREVNSHWNWHWIWNSNLVESCKIFLIVKESCCLWKNFDDYCRIL